MLSNAQNSEPLSVLCYGDSNTHGSPAEPVDFPRWESKIRWTGRLQQTLGTSYKVIEEGLPGRTIEIDYADPPLAGRSGLPYFGPCIQSHDPLHAVIIMLGTNDLKVEFDLTPTQIAAPLTSYVNLVRANTAQADGSPTRIILVSPAHINDTKPLFNSPDSAYDHTSVLRSRQLANEIQLIADQQNTDFVDAAAVTTVGADGIHLAVESHQPLAECLTKVVSAFN